MKRIFAILAIVLSMLALLAACGSDSSGAESLNGIAPSGTVQTQSGQNAIRSNQSPSRSRSPNPNQSEQIRFRGSGQRFGRSGRCRRSGRCCHTAVFVGTR